jgi:glycosyltransferase involved in cell wall biosynthesis
MRALVIAPQPFFSPRGTPYSVYFRTLVTAQLGVEIDLLTYGEGADVDLPGARILRIPRLPFARKVPIGPSYKKLALDLTLFLWTVRSLLTRRYDFVHAHEESVFFCRLLKPLFGFKLVYDMHSSLPEQLTNFQFTKSRLLIGLFERLESSALDAADAVITICPDLASYAVPRMRDPKRHFLIENSIFGDVRLRADGGPAADDDRPVREPPAGRPMILYAGTFEPYQGIELLIRAFALARPKCPDALLLLVGGQPRQVDHYAALAADLGLERHCLFTGTVAQPTVRRWLRQATLLASPRVSGNNTPLKIYEQLASGIPLLATRIRSHTQVVSDEVCFLVDPTPEAMAEGLAAALSSREAREQVAQKALALYVEKYSPAVYEQKMRQLLSVLH